MDLRKLFVDAKDKLASGDFFTAESEADVVGYVRGHGMDSIQPLQRFIAWLDRVPEARELIMASGLGWGTPGTPGANVGDSKAVSVVTGTDEGTPLVFRARVGGKFVNVRLIEAIGSILKVHVQGTPDGLLTAIHANQVSPVDAPAVNVYLKGLPGHDVQVDFEDDEGKPDTKIDDGKVRIDPTNPDDFV